MYDVNNNRNNTTINYNNKNKNNGNISTDGIFHPYGLLAVIIRVQCPPSHLRMGVPLESLARTCWPLGAGFYYYYKIVNLLNSIYS